MIHNSLLKGLLTTIPLMALVFIAPVSFAADPGAQILEDRCTLCHDKPDPAKLTKEEWVLKLEVMAPTAGLSSTETSEVLDYVSSRAKGAASVLSMVNEKALFDEKCSLCHTTNRALIMPMTAESVAEIIPRMQKMAGDWITDEQAQEISEYLVHGAPESDRPARSELATNDPYELIIQRCTSCHTAERFFHQLRSDKEGKTKANWTEIVNRMQIKAPNWITQSEADNIIKFLNAM